MKVVNKKKLRCVENVTWIYVTYDVEKIEVEKIDYKHLH